MPATFTVERTPTTELRDTALTLVKAGYITPAMFADRKGDLTACITDAVAAIAKRERPNPIANLKALIADNPERAEIGDAAESEHHSEYNARKKCQATKVSVLVVGNPDEKPIHRVIGPRIKQLEHFRSGLGLTVLHWMSEAFHHSSRACDPMTCLGLASHHYWMGEQDETFRLQEEMDDARHYHETQQKQLPEKERKPFDEKDAAKELGIFTIADYYKDIPKEVANLREPKLTIEQLKRIRLPAPKTLGEVFSDAPDLITATIACAKLMADTPHLTEVTDLGCFENLRWEISPFLLRWQRGEPTDEQGRVKVTANGKPEWEQDSMGMIWDDYMNNEYSSGETNMNAIAAWGWHDAPSLVNAMQRFERWCRLLQAAETLLNLVQPEDVNIEA